MLGCIAALSLVGPMAPPENPTFLGHKPLPNSSVASFAQTDRWIYTFEGDWDSVVVKVKQEYAKDGYKEEPADTKRIREAMKLSHSMKRRGQYFLDNTVTLRRGDYLVVSVIVLEDSVRLVRDCRLGKAADWSTIGPDKRRDKGWITVILARPKKDSAFSKM
jgi:hypothetical protein